MTDVDRARELFAARVWREAYDALKGIEDLDADDLERLATAAYLLGNTEEYLAYLERAHRQHLDPLRAGECAIWIGITRYSAGETAQAAGWFARAQRLVEEDGRDTALLGHLLVPAIFENEASGDFDAAAEFAAECEAIGRRVGDADLVALAGYTHGQMLIRAGHVAEGIRCLDEAMMAAVSGELSPIVNGIVYCGVIVGCRMAYDLGRAKEWTATMLGWCEEQPDLVPYAGLCRVHHAELLDLAGSWREALVEAGAVTEPVALADAAYLKGELHRELGLYGAADAHFREASRLGREPQPGLALLRLAQGSTQAAMAMVRRCLRETDDQVQRAGLLPAAVEILVRGGELGDAAEAAAELERLAERFGSSVLVASSEHAAGAVALAKDEGEKALRLLRSALARWLALGAPYEAARTRMLIAQGCRLLGDDESADLERTAARETFVRLGAAADLAHVDSASTRPPLTPRELVVLRMLAAGATNRVIAADLVLSERTVDRHVSNILAKLGVSSRTAAAAYAVQKELV